MSSGNTVLTPTDQSLESTVEPSTELLTGSRLLSDVTCTEAVLWQIFNV